MARFFVVDQSLNGVGGHHFDTVRLISEAAANRGFDIVACTHKSLDAKKFKLPNATVRPLFRNTTYTDLSHLGALRETTRSRVPSLPQQPPSGLSPGKFLNRLRHRSLVNRQDRYISEFAEDCQSLFQRETFDELDHVLFMTMNELEFMGLAAFLANNPTTIHANWQVVFHFGIFAGWPANYSSQKKQLDSIRYAFQSSLARIPYHQLTFLASTDELAEQYNQLSIGYFQTLPYPIDQKISSDRATVSFDSPFQLTLAGGLRREKGKKEINKVVRGLSELKNEGTRIQLTLQKRKRKWYQPTDIRIDLPQVSDAPQNKEEPLLNFVKHPLDADAYCDLIQNTDIGLLLYDKRTYYARRAGVLSEYLTAGCPVVVPAGCWLSHQLAEPTFRYIDRVVDGHRVAKPLGVEEMKHSTNNVPQSGGVISFDQTRNPFEIEGDLERPVAGVVVQFDWHWPKHQGTYAKIEFQGFDESGNLVSSDVQVVGHRKAHSSPCVLFVCSELERRFKVVIRNAYSDSPASIRELFVTPIGQPGQRFAKGAVGYSFNDYHEVPQAVSEIIENYSHYASTAAEFSIQWAKQHDPDYTVEFLLGKTTDLRCVA